MESVMPCYTFLVGNKKVACEKPDVVLPDHETAREYAIDFASALFQYHHELCAGEWHLCSIHVRTDADQFVFSTTVVNAAVIERDGIRRLGRARVTN
jgi:hypothetical protein